MNVLVKKQDLAKFFDNLHKKYEIIGPTRKGKVITFDEIDSIEDVCMDEQTDFSFRKLFLPDGETLFDYKDGKPKAPTVEIKKRIVLCRPCDANALLNIDKIYLDEYQDELYKLRRENTLLFVIKCQEPFKNCFCSSLGTADTTNYDLLFIRMGDKFIVRSGSEEGDKLKSQKIFFPIIRDGRVLVDCERKADNLKKLEIYHEDPEWEKEADKCLNCNACITVCPTCMCFTVRDESNVDMKTGKRTRHWDFCHIKDFTKVAGGFVFRENKVQRFKHRINHKLKFFKERHGRHLCVGCGRCINICPANIDMLKIVDNLGKDGNQNN